MHMIMYGRFTGHTKGIDDLWSDGVQYLDVTEEFIQ
jgi:hypothetical protein